MLCFYVMFYVMLCYFREAGNPKKFSPSRRRLLSRSLVSHCHYNPSSSSLSSFINLCSFVCSFVRSFVRSSSFFTTRFYFRLCRSFVRSLSRLRTVQHTTYIIFDLVRHISSLLFVIIIIIIICLHHLHIMYPWFYLSLLRYMFISLLCLFLDLDLSPVLSHLISS